MTPAHERAPQEAAGAPLPPLICPACRGVDAAGVFHAHALRGDGACPGCDLVHPVVDELAVVLGGRDDAAARHRAEIADLTYRAQRWARAACATTSGAALPPLAMGDEASGASALTWAATQFGAWASSRSAALGPPPWPWLADAVAAAGPGAGGPVLVLGGACGGAVTWLPPSSARPTVLDATPHALALGHALADAMVLPVADEPWSTAAVPLSLPPLARSRLRQTRWIVGDLHDPPFGAGTFGLVLALGVLDSVRDPWLALNQAVALLRPGGALVVSLPYADQEAIAPPAMWLSSLARAAGCQHPYDALTSGILVQSEPVRCVWARRDVPWSVRPHRRLATTYLCDALVLVRAEAT